MRTVCKLRVIVASPTCNNSHVVRATAYSSNRFVYVIKLLYLLGCLSKWNLSAVTKDTVPPTVDVSWFWKTSTTNQQTNKQTNKNAGFKDKLHYVSVQCCYSEDCDTVTTSPIRQIFAEEFYEYVQIIQSQLYSKNGLRCWASRRNTNATIESHD